MRLPLDNAHREKRPPAARRGEAGYALTELLLVSSLLAIVLGAILALGETTQRITPRDTERAHGALRVAPDAVEVDTTDMSADDVVARVVELARERGLA